MPVDVTRTLRRALTQLESERNRLDHQIRTIRAALGGSDGPRAAGGQRRRRPMSAAARRAVSQRMKAYWAARRGKKAKKAG